MSITTDHQILLKAIEKLNRTKARQEEALAATIGQLDLFNQLLTQPTTSDKPKK